MSSKDNADDENKAINVDGTDEDEDDDPVDDEQLEEYQEMIEQLGTFPVCTGYPNRPRNLDCPLKSHLLTLKFSNPG